MHFYFNIYRFNHLRIYNIYGIFKGKYKGEIYLITYGFFWNKTRFNNLRLPVIYIENKVCLSLFRGNTYTLNHSRIFWNLYGIFQRENITQT